MAAASSPRSLIRPRGRRRPPSPTSAITLGLDAVPVRRGVTRVAPGTLLPIAGAHRHRAGVRSFATAIGLPGRTPLEAAALAELVRAAPWSAPSPTCASASIGHSAVAVITDGKTARSAAA